MSEEADVSGIWNRLGALLGVVGGIGLIWAFFYFTYVR